MDRIHNKHLQPILDTLPRLHSFGRSLLVDQPSQPALLLVAKKRQEVQLLVEGSLCRQLTNNDSIHGIVF